MRSARKDSTGTQQPTSAILHRTPDAWRTRVLNAPNSQDDHRHPAHNSPSTQDRKSNIPTSWTARSTTLPGELSSSHTILTARSSTSASMVAPFCKFIHDYVITFWPFNFPTDSAAQPATRGISARITAIVSRTSGAPCQDVHCKSSESLDNIMKALICYW